MSSSKKFTPIPASTTMPWAFMPAERGESRNRTVSATSWVETAFFLSVAASANR